MGDHRPPILNARDTQGLRTKCAYQPKGHIATSTKHPFHPATGQRLIRVIETAFFLRAARIVEIGDASVIDDTQSQRMEANKIERAQIDGIPFVATISGHTCLFSEAIWSPLDVEQLEGVTEKSTGTDIPTLNGAMCELIHLGETSQAVVDSWAATSLSTAVCNLEGAVHASALLSSHLCEGRVNFQD
jgi:hypothetical protein